MGLGLVIAPLLFISCDRGRVQVSVHRHLDARQALHVFTSASDQSERERAVLRIRENASPDFDWTSFWSSLGQADQLKKVEETTLDRLFGLHSMSCELKHFQSFGKLARGFEIGWTHLDPPKRKCSTPLDEETVQSILKDFKKDSNGVLPDQQKKAVFVARVLREEAKINRVGHWHSTLSVLEEDEWGKISASLIESREPESELLVALADLHAEKIGHVQFISKLLKSNLNNSKHLSRLIKRLSLPVVVHLSRQFVSDQIKQLTQKEAHFILEQFASAFQLELKRSLSLHGATLPLEMLKQNWKLLMDLRSLERQLADLHAVHHALDWFEGVYRDFEVQLLADEKIIAEFLSYLPPGSSSQGADALWFKLRMRKKIKSLELPGLDVEPVSTPASLTFLDRVLASRLVAHAQPSEKAIQQFCDILDAAGIKTRKMLSAEVQKLTEWVKTPGCIEIETQTTTIEVTLDSPKFTMRFDTAVIAHDLSLKIKTQQLDASLFNLSAALTHPDLPIELPPTEDAAFTFPLMVGFKISNEKIFRGPGTYYFILHHIEREAKPGLPAQAQANAGYPGGTIELAGLLTASLPSFLPTLVSDGGPGQKAVPQRRGGAEDSTVISFSLYNKFIARWSVSSSNQASTATSDKFLEDPTVAILRDILAHADKSAEPLSEIQVYIKKDFSFLTEDQIQKKLFPACPDLKEDCLREKAQAALKALKNYLESQQISESVVLSQVKTRQMTVSEGPLGPKNQDGVAGSKGQVILESEENLNGEI